MKLKVASLEKTGNTNKDQKTRTLKKLLKSILLTKRTLKGIELYQKGLIKENGFNQWKVSSLEKTYNVHFNHGKWACTCPDHQYRGRTCKHIHAAQIHSKYTTHPAPKLTFNEMVEIEKQLYPHPISSLETRIENMKTVLVG